MPTINSIGRIIPSMEIEVCLSKWKKKNPTRPKDITLPITISADRKNIHFACKSLILYDCFFGISDVLLMDCGFIAKASKGNQ